MNLYTQIFHCWLVSCLNYGFCKSNVLSSSDVLDPCWSYKYIAIPSCYDFGSIASADPLFHDPYVACLVPGDTPVYTKQHVHNYCLATRFIDDTLLQTLRSTEELKQVYHFQNMKLPLLVKCGNNGLGNYEYYVGCFIDRWCGYACISTNLAKLYIDIWHITW